MNTLSHFAEMWLGLGVEPKDLTFVQISLRGVIVINAALLMIRLGRKRSLAEKTVFDAVLIVTLASVPARTMNGSSPFFPDHRVWVCPGLPSPVVCVDRVSLSSVRHPDRRRAALPCAGRENSLGHNESESNLET
jgi:hypothetical protein